jgi:hypothetical protein
MAVLIFVNRLQELEITCRKIIFAGRDWPPGSQPVNSFRVRGGGLIPARAGTARRWRRLRTQAAGSARSSQSFQRPKMGWFLILGALASMIEHKLFGEAGFFTRDIQFTLGYVTKVSDSMETPFANDRSYRTVKSRPSIGSHSYFRRSETASCRFSG